MGDVIGLHDLPPPAAFPATKPRISRDDKAYEQEILRRRIDGAMRLGAIDDILSWLVTGYAPEFAEPVGGTQNCSRRRIGWKQIEPSEAKRLSIVLDTQMKLLNKVLPDLKSSEVTMEKTERRYTDLELASRVASLVNRAKGGQSLPSSSPSSYPSYPSAAPATPARTALEEIYGGLPR